MNIPTRCPSLLALSSTLPSDSDTNMTHTLSQSHPNPIYQQAQTDAWSPTGIVLDPHRLQIDTVNENWS